MNYIITFFAISATAVAATTLAGHEKRDSCGQWDTISTSRHTLYSDLWNEASGTGWGCIGLDYQSGNQISSTGGTRSGLGARDVYSNHMEMEFVKLLRGSAELEIMIWLAALGGAGPISSTGPPIATPTIAGTTWNLYPGPNGKTTIYSSVASSKVTSSSVDLLEFIPIFSPAKGFRRANSDDFLYYDALSNVECVKRPLLDTNTLSAILAATPQRNPSVVHIAGKVSPVRMLFTVTFNRIRKSQSTRSAAALELASHVPRLKSVAHGEFPVNDVNSDSWNAFILYHESESTVLHCHRYVPLLVKRGMSTTCTWPHLPAQLTNTIATFENDMNIIFEGDPAPCSLNLEENCNEWPASMLSVNWLYPQDLAMEDSQSDGLSYSSAGTASQSSAGLEMGLAQVYDESARDSFGLGSTQIHSTGPKTKFPTSEGTLESSLSSSPSFDGMYYVEGTAGRAAFNRRINRRNNGMESTTSERERISASSDLSSISQDAFVSQTVYEDLLCKVQAKCNSLGLGPDKATLPTRSEIEQHIQSYFNGFHATYPFLQKKPSQFVSTGGWLLLLAVAAVGLRYSHKEPETSLSYLVDRIVSDHFNDFECNDNEQPWIPGTDAHESSVLDLIIVQAGLLNCLLLLHSGRTNLIKRALNQRYRLVEACDWLGLLSAVESTPLNRIEAVNSEDVVSRWVNEEARVRTGWMMWMLDSVVLYEFNHLPLLQIGDVKIPLPCREEVWHCGTADMITNEKYRTDALEILYLEKKMPPNLGDLATNMLILGICRRTREATIQSQTKLTTWSPTAKQQHHSHRGTQVESWPPALPSVSKWRNSACDCLDILHWEANATVAHTRGWENPTIFHLHLARLLILVPIHHIQRLATPSKSDYAGYKTSKHHVVRWANFDQFKARLSLVHAGALFCTKMPQNDEDEGDSQSTVIQLDRPCDDEIIQMYIRFGPRLSARMTGVGRICEASSPRRILKQGLRLLDGLEERESSSLPENLEGPKTVNPNWGISRSFSEILRLLVTLQCNPEQETNRAEAETSRNIIS
ncbi:hypothetical protein ZTR_04382 [Talaromyces verruculosus]|nr:hypothetical protein ZTR_04382 [Talaromyces verruculosus]